ncbi:uncharacterized protein LOC115630629 [Scaptodrosophila lebanonensis]|uniref:Uncharacterized protein LOC115630629 n=1 Tax=Drosophila lebanonensis TaxID=7225 RepID=A0A6J2U6F4_DROLE|nr:uncharacterized protein LOC115630629 [Scaptodrosophila lebanonensis]
MMGCGSSMNTESVNEEPTTATGMFLQMQQNGGTKAQNIVQQYVRLDEQISKLEATCPGPRMATAEAWIDHLQTKRDAMLGLEGMDREQREQLLQRNQRLLQQKPQTEDDAEPLTLNGYPLPAPTTQRLPGGGSEIVANTPTKDLAQLAHNLGVIGDERKASTHEDFFANLSESALYLLSIRYYSEVLEHTKVRLKKLIERYAELNELYVNQDGIIAFISGGTYMSRLEESIDAQLETARDIRDKLGSTLEQWRICGTLLRAAANSATQALKQWHQLGRLVDPQYKLQAALECRSLFHASLISLECAQMALPHVELKYMSNRQILAVAHCNTYLITDIANSARYEHTSKVFANYESNISKTSTWLYDTFNKTLRKDFEKAEDTVKRLAKTLREHRDEIFSAVRK